ncbi:MAG: 2TM domain-containing protein [Sphingobacteriaceae bacterium]|nr:2TM domain-containing protein [Sphingobacteriaceae bacterium]
MNTLQDEKDRILWKQAKKRVEFRNHLYTYLVVNTFLWVLWFITGKEKEDGGIPWPLFCTLGWGFGLFWHFIGAYILKTGTSQIEKEFQKLKEQQNK